MSRHKKWFCPLAVFALLSVALLYVGERSKVARARQRALLTIQLQEAIKWRDSKQAIQLLKLGADANAKGEDGIPLVFSCADIRDVALLKAFIAAGVNVNSTYSPSPGQRVTLLTNVGLYAETLFPYQVDMMKCLLDAGANPNLGTESVLANNAGSCGEGCWCNPREVSLLLQHGAKLRKGDAAAILEDTVGDDTEDGLLLTRIWATLPLPSQERRTELRKVIKVCYDSYRDGEKSKSLTETIAFLQHKLREIDNGSRRTKSYVPLPLT